MAKVFGSQNGTILGYARSQQEESIYFPTAPAGTITRLDFDESTNPQLVVDLTANLDHYTLVTVNSAPVLQKDGTPVQIAASDQFYSLRNAIFNGFTDAQIKSAVVALWNGTATAGQSQKALAYIIVKLRQANLI